MTVAKKLNAFQVVINTIQSFKFACEKINRIYSPGAQRQEIFKESET